MSQIARLFQNGRSQAVRLPAHCRFDTSEVYIRKDPETGDVILSRKPDTWDGFLATLNDLDVPTDFLDRQDRQEPVQARDPFAGWTE